MNTPRAILSTLQQSPSPLQVSLVTVRACPNEPTASVERCLSAMVDSGLAYRRRHPALRAWLFTDDEAKFGERVKLADQSTQEPDFDCETVLAFINTHPMCSLGEIRNGIGALSERSADRIQNFLFRLLGGHRITRHGRPGKYRYMPKLEGRP